MTRNATGKGDGGPEHQLRHAQPRLRRQPVRDSGAQALRQRVALGRIERLHDQLGEGGIREFWVVAEIEPRRAATDVGGDHACLGLRGQPRLHACGGRTGAGDAAAFRHLHFHQHFRPVGAGEELLLEAEHAHARQHEQPHHAAHHQPASPHRPMHQPAQAAIARRLIKLRVSAWHGADRRQQHHAQIRREHHRHHPGGEQRVTHDPEDIAGIFAGGGFGEAHRHQPDDRHERSGKHGSGRMAPGIRGRFDAVCPLLQPHQHNFDGDDRIVHQQAKRED